jgi:hypothetical protein
LSSGAAVPYYDIPEKHLVHVVEKVLKLTNKDREELKKYCTSRNPAERQAAFSRINEVNPGLLGEMQNVWAFPTRHSVHLWTSRALKDLSPGSVSLSSFKSGEGGKIVKDELVFPRDDDDTKARVHRVRVLADGALDVEVRITKPVVVPFEDEERVVERTTDVPLMVDLNRPERLVEVYAGYSEARKALITFLEWFVGETIPKRAGGRQARYFEPLVFGEQHVKNLAKKLKLGNPTSMRGPPPLKNAYEVQLWGGPEGTVIPLDFSKPHIKDQDAMPNKERWYPFPYLHPDGYPETTVVAFNFTTKQPRVSFRLRTSRPAINRVLSELCREVGRG